MAIWTQSFSGGDLSHFTEEQNGAEGRCRNKEITFGHLFDNVIVNTCFQDIFSYFHSTQHSAVTTVTQDGCNIINATFTQTKAYGGAYSRS